jgi:hypothetical protein
MLRVQERRRHVRIALSFPAVIRDRAGRVLLRGRSADIAPGGVRVIGRGGASLREGLEVWVELVVPRLGSSGPRQRIAKLRGEVRRITVMGEWRSVVVVVFETDFASNLLDPTL